MLRILFPVAQVYALAQKTNKITLGTENLQIPLNL